MGLLSRLKNRLSRTRATLSDGLSALFKGGREMDAALLSELEETFPRAACRTTASTSPPIAWRR